MCKWIKMYWLLIRNRSETKEYIKRHESSIKYTPVIWSEIFMIILTISLRSNNNRIVNIAILSTFILLLINIFMCNKIVSVNNKLIIQDNLKKENEKLEDKARHILVKTINIMKLYYPMNEINDYYNNCSKMINETISTNNLDYINIKLDAIITNLEANWHVIEEQIYQFKRKEKQEKDYVAYKNWRKIHNIYTNYDEYNQWTNFEQRYQKEFGKQQYNSNIDNVSDKEKYLKILGLPLMNDFNIIKKQYTKLIKKYHPDICHDNGERAKEINVAYQELKKIFNY